MNYQFDKEHISQHVVKYGVDVRPPIILKHDKTKLQDYCNALIEQFPEVFETLVAGPRQLRIQNTFLLSNNKRAEMPTFILTARGPLFTFPQRLYIDGIQDFDLPQKDKIFRKALDELRAKFVDRAIPRVGVVHEFIFDTGQVDSVQILASSFKNDLWRQRAKNLRILLETPMEEKNVNVQIRPTQLRRITRGEPSVPDQDVAFGIIVNVDINNRNVKGDLTSSEVRDIVAFANDYVPEELIKFLNNEY
ncbi:MAG: hypothetical protein GWN67_24900 [Phycisphaerae bacterium]|nr:hypothetical protein [Phycisphaerae bacterium]NIP55361.1 hypothetical protein [Phycisphaerae bacterium]NIS54130.1 hypothetical protein [Phycisphaerae bacterium]NIU11682.1 hypothetical protein [Phycisphaerae bacterium]NIU59504.1 hypothetical protein [Phycisphaerae bacterium]